STCRPRESYSTMLPLTRAMALSTTNRGASSISSVTLPSLLPFPRRPLLPRGGRCRQIGPKRAARFGSSLPGKRHPLNLEQEAAGIEVGNKGSPCASPLHLLGRPGDVQANADVAIVEPWDR